MNIATITVLAIVALAVGFAIKSMVGGHGCDSCEDCCNGDCGNCRSCNAAEKMLHDIDASDSESSSTLTRIECECAGGRWL